MSKNLCWISCAAWLFCAGSGNVRGATYHVDALHGSDDADGQAAPWKTLSKVNATTFSPGDKILFAAGQSWTGQLHPLGSGAMGGPIVIDRYGEGGLPSIAANGETAAVRLFNQSYWEIRSLEVTNTAAQPGDLRGISIEGCDAGVLSHIVIEGCLVHNVSGEARYFGSGTGPYEIGKRTGGIVFWTDAQTGLKTKFDDVLIRGNTVTDNAFGGIVFKQTNKYQWAMREGGINDPAWYPHTRIRVENNVIDQSGSTGNLVAILLTAVRNATVSGNRLEHAHQCGIELDYAEDCLVEKNEVEHTTKGATGTDSCALDFDRCCDRTTWRYNYLNDNGVGVLSCHGIHPWDFGSDNRVVFNVVQDCRDKGVFLVSRGGPDYICNNVFYSGQHKNVPMVEARNNHADTVVANNIFQQAGPGGALGENPSVRYDANCYWGGLKIPASDRHAVNADPRFVDPGKGRDGYKLQPGSPCFGAGVPVPGGPGFDFWGAAFKVEKPNIGAYVPATN